MIRTVVKDTKYEIITVLSPNWKSEDNNYKVFWGCFNSAYLFHTLLTSSKIFGKQFMLLVKYICVSKMQFQNFKCFAK